MNLLQRIYTFCIGVILMTLTATEIHAESNFNLTVYGGSSNFWSNTLFQFPASFLSNLTTFLINDEQYVGGSYRYDLLNIKENGHKVPSYKGRFFGFKAKDLFSNIHYGLKLGWSPEYSVFGLYIACSYQFRRFEADFANIGNHTYKLNSVRPGIGIRLTPFLELIEDEKWSPMLEAGASYNYNFKTKGAFENAKKQFNNGIVSSFAIGVRNQNVAISGGVEIDHYTLFNKKYSPDGGITLPYSDVKTHHIVIFISFSHEFN